MTTAIDLDEVQGLVVTAYGDLPHAAYVVFTIEDADLARAWIGRLVEPVPGRPHIQFGEHRKTARNLPPFLPEICLNLAFTAVGFERLGVPEIARKGFSLPFQEGMSEPSRARRLGDDGASSPETWEWGHGERAVHGVLAIFTKDGDRADAEARIAKVIANEIRDEHGVACVRELRSTPTDRVNRKEHFGFRDGIANPRFASLSRPTAHDRVPDGELLLGYRNAYDELPLSPEVEAADDPLELLPPSEDRDDRRDFGKNGSYLVFRQLAQDVQRFWEFLHEAAPRVPEAPKGKEGAKWLGAKLVGRWPDGSPVVRHPHHEGGEAHANDNDFLYGRARDPFGHKCPIGSHIRRTNPRDTALPVPHDVDLSGNSEDGKVAEEHVKLSSRHRILRRGRPYGAPIDAEFDPEKMRLAPRREGDERGIYFLCFNANLGRQFEFVQSNWAMNPSFAGMSADPDPLLGAGRACPFSASDFTLQGYPVRRVRGLPRVIETRGGAYFFMPSRSALRYLSRGYGAARR